MSSNYNFPRPVQTPDQLLNTIDERRSSDRMVVNDLAEMLVDINGTVKTCLVHNLSETGAMVEFSFHKIPKRVVLVNQKRNLRIVCNVVWHCGELAGLEFIRPRSCR